MSKPSFLLAQLSDPHIGGTWAGDDSVPRLAAAVEAVRSVKPRPDAVVVTGDLVDHATDEEYAQLRELLDPLGAPTYVLPGNHDGRATLRRHFDVPGREGEPVQFSADLGPLRLIALDTTIPGEEAGALGTDRLEWLDAELAAAPEALTLVAMHHPPFVTGVRVWDELGLPAADREALGEVIERHRQVRRLVAGHFHGTMTGELAGCSALAIPSTYAQFQLDFTEQEIELSTAPAGFAVHAVVDGELVSHVRAVH